MQARYYDPVIGRFYSNDPVGTLGHSNIAHGFNRYAYANNNPYKYNDPDGKLPVLLVFVAKEALGEAFEQATGIPAPTVKGLSKALAKRFARGRASEARKLNQRGIDKNTEKFEGPEGNTIPDGIDPTTGNLVEVKDVKNLANTKQIRNQTAVAEEKGVKLEIDTGVNTKVSKNLEQNPNVIIKRHEDLGNGDK